MNSGTFETQKQNKLSHWYKFGLPGSKFGAEFGIRVGPEFGRKVRLCNLGL